MPEQRSKNFEKVKNITTMVFGKSKECVMQFLDGLHQKNLNLLLASHIWKNN